MIKRVSIFFYLSGRLIQRLSFYKANEKLKTYYKAPGNEYLEQIRRYKNLYKIRLLFNSLLHDLYGLNNLHHLKCVKNVAIFNFQFPYIIYRKNMKVILLNLN